MEGEAELVVVAQATDTNLIRGGREDRRRTAEPKYFVSPSQFSDLQHPSEHEISQINVERLPVALILAHGGLSDLELELLPLWSLKYLVFVIKIYGKTCTSQ